MQLREARGNGYAVLRCAAGCALISVFVAGANPDAIAAPEQTVLKSESFDRDPGWEAINNRIVPERRRPYAGLRLPPRRATMGGRLTRTTKPAYYAAEIEPKTLERQAHRLRNVHAEKSTAASGVFFGWFNANQPVARGRPIGSLGLNFDGERAGGRLAVRLITG